MMQAIDLQLREGHSFASSAAHADLAFSGLTDFGTNRIVACKDRGVATQAMALSLLPGLKAEVADCKWYTLEDLAILDGNDRRIAQSLLDGGAGLLGTSGYSPTHKNALFGR